MKEYLSNSEAQTEEFARLLAGSLKAGDILAYRGGLGVGKTAFTRGLACGLGVTDDVSSPTFALVHEYQGGRLPLCHFDMYRVTDLDSLYSTGFFDYLDGTRVLAVEWSENIQDFLPEHTMWVTIETLGETTRRIVVEGERL